MTATPIPDATQLERAQLRRLEVASLIEATTLVVLVGVAVPLKHLAHLDAAVRIMGPVHGLAFLAYIWTGFQTIFGGGWRPADAARLFVVAFIPLAGFANLRWLRTRATRLACGDAPA